MDDTYLVNDCGCCLILTFCISGDIPSMQLYVLFFYILGDTWCDKSVDIFDELTYASKWKVLMAKKVGHHVTSTGTCPVLELVDTNKETVSGNPVILISNAGPFKLVFLGSGPTIL